MPDPMLFDLHKEPRGIALQVTKLPIGEVDDAKA